MVFWGAGKVSVSSVAEVDVLDVTGSFVSSPSFELAKTVNFALAPRACEVTGKKHREAGETTVLELDSFEMFELQD